MQQLANFLVEAPFVAAGQPAVRFDPSATAHADQEFHAAFERELAAELPWRDWAELEGKGCDAERLAGVDSGANPSTVVGSGIALDGVVYTRPFPTAFGPYPYPRQMRHGVWSCTKSLIGLAMAARLASGVAFVSMPPGSFRMMTPNGMNIQAA